MAFETVLRSRAVSLRGSRRNIPQVVIRNKDKDHFFRNAHHEHNRPRIRSQHPSVRHGLRH